MNEIQQIIELVNNLDNEESCDAAAIDLLISRIKNLLKSDKTNGLELVPFISKLTKLKHQNNKKNEVKSQITPSFGEAEKRSNWVEVKGGFLKIGPKPGGKIRNLQNLQSEGASTVLTILSEREGAKNIAETCKNLNINWIWLQLADGKIPSPLINPEIIELFNEIKQKLAQKERIYIHCSAGLHRTGMITNALLMFLGFNENESFEFLQQLRTITAKELRPDRANWGKQFCNLGD